MIKFSICIPAFKVKFLKECIDSILNQSYGNFELIVLDDCSPYNIEEVVSSYTDTRLSYYKNESNVGSENLVENWNKCLEMSTGDFLIIMGDDDMLEPSYLDEFLILINKYPALDVFHCRSKIINDKNEVKLLTPSWPEYESVYDNIWHRITAKRDQYISDFVYRVDSLRSKGGFYFMPLAWGSDDITSFILATEKGIAHTNEPVFRYRSHDSSITSTGKIDLKLKANTMYFLWLDSFLKQPPLLESDQIMHKELKNNFKIYLRRRNVSALTKSMTGDFSSGWHLVKVFKRYQLPLSDVVYIILNSSRRKILNK